MQPHPDAVGLCRKSVIVPPIKECSAGFHVRPPYHVRRLHAEDDIEADIEDGEEEILEGLSVRPAFSVPTIESVYETGPHTLFEPSLSDSEEAFDLASEYDPVPYDVSFGAEVSEEDMLVALSSSRRAEGQDGSAFAWQVNRIPIGGGVGPMGGVSSLTGLPSLGGVAVSSGDVGLAGPVVGGIAVGDSSMVDMEKLGGGWTHLKAGDRLHAILPADPDEICERVTTEPPVALCRDGFEFNLSEGKCVKRILEEPRLICQKADFVFDGKVGIYTHTHADIHRYAHKTHNTHTHTCTH